MNERSNFDIMLILRMVIISMIVRRRPDIIKELQLFFLICSAGVSEYQSIQSEIILAIDF